MKIYLIAEIEHEKRNNMIVFTSPESAEINYFRNYLKKNCNVDYEEFKNIDKRFSKNALILLTNDRESIFKIEEVYNVYYKKKRFFKGNFNFFGENSKLYTYASSYALAFMQFCVQLSKKYNKDKMYFLGYFRDSNRYNISDLKNIGI